MVSPQNSNVDGKVWTNNQEYHDMYRLDVATGKFENAGPSKDPRRQADLAPTACRPTRSNNVYQLEFGGTSIGLRDAKTGTDDDLSDADHSARVRGAAGSTSQNRLWFAEYDGNAIGDVRSEDRQDHRISAADQVGQPL